MPKPPPKPDDGRRKRQRDRKARGIETPRCGHPKRDGEKCRAYVVEGSARCRKHGGKPTPDGGEIDAHTVTGAKSPKFQMLKREGLDRLAELEADPGLLSVKRAAALSAFLVEQMVIAPTDEQIEVRAEALAEASGVQVDDTLRALARNEIIAAVHRVVKDHAGVVFSANKTQRAGELIVSEALPILAKFSEGVKRLIEHYVRDERIREKFIADLRDHVMVAIANMSRMGQDRD